MRDLGYKKAYCWVLENNPTIKFYERAGAKFSSQVKQDEIGGKTFNELAYEWNDNNIGEYNWEPLSLDLILGHFSDESVPQFDKIREGDQESRNFADNLDMVPSSLGRLLAIVVAAEVLLLGCGYTNGSIENQIESGSTTSAVFPVLTSTKHIGPAIVSAVPVAGTCPATATTVEAEIGGNKLVFACVNGAFLGTADLSLLAEGTYSLKLTANIGISSSCSIVRDDTKPSAPGALVNAAFVRSITTTPALTWSDSIDALSGVERYEARLLKDSDSSVIADWTTLLSAGTFSGLSLVEGTVYRYQLRAVDKAANISDPTDSPTFRPDETVPVSITTITQTRAAEAALSPEFTWTATWDLISGVDYYQVSLGTASGFTDLVSWNTVSATATLIFPQQIVAVIPGQVYYFNVRAVDKAGNVGAVLSADWTLPQKLDYQVNFVGHGPIFPNYESLKSMVTASAKDASSGKYYIGGLILDAGVTPNYNRMVRLNSDGTLDAGFSLGTGFNGSVYKVLIQTDGKILVGGDFTTYQGSADSRLIRLNSDGSRDPSFSTGSGFDGKVSTLFMDNQVAGRIYVAGSFSNYNGTSVGGIARLNADGSLDASFATGTGIVGPVYDLYVLADGRVLAAGDISEFNGVTNLYQMICLMPDGSRDLTYVTTTSNPWGNGISRIRSAGGSNLFLAGEDWPFSYNGTMGNPLIRINGLTGTKDPAFTAWPGDYIFSMGVDAANRPIIVTTDSGSSVIRMTTTGSTDNSFGATPFGTWSSNVQNSWVRSPVGDVAVQADGRVLLGGNLTYLGEAAYNGGRPYQFGHLVRLTSAGLVDTAFLNNQGTGFNDNVNTLALQADGKILVGGDFIHFGSTPKKHIVRLNADFSVDNTFSAIDFFSNFGYPTAIHKILVQPDGKLLVGGDFSSIYSNYSYLVRLNTNGTIDTSFPTYAGSGTSSEGFRDLALQTDGKVIAVGQFGDYNSAVTGHILRFNTNGTIDGGYNIGTGFSGPASSIVLQSDGKALVAGNFNQYNGSAVKAIVRLNTDGTLDTTFAFALTDGSCSNLRIQTDGKIIVICSAIRRLNADGTLDTTFTAATISGTMTFLEPLSSGKYLVGTQTKGAFRLNADGSRDLTFYTPIAGDVRTALILSATDYWLGGFFTKYDQTPVMHSVIIGAP